MSNLIKTILPILLVGLASMFGFVLDPDNALVVGFVGLMETVPVGVQLAIVLALTLLSLLPHIAARTPWTWDDWTIQHKGLVKRTLGSIWNALAGNYGKAKNSGSS